MAAISLSSMRRTRAEAPGFTCVQRLQEMRDRGADAGRVDAAVEAQVRGVHGGGVEQPVHGAARAAQPGGEGVVHREVGGQAEQRFADDGGEEGAGGAVRAAGADDDGGQADADRIEEAAAGGVRQDQFGRGLLRAVAVGGHLARFVLDHGVLAAGEAGDRGGEHDAGRLAAEATAGVDHGVGAADVDAPAELVVGLGLGGDDRGQVEDHVGVGRDRVGGELDEVAGDGVDRKCRVGLRRRGDVEQRQAGDGCVAQLAVARQSGGDLATQETAAAENGNPHEPSPTLRRHDCTPS